MRGMYVLRTVWRDDLDQYENWISMKKDTPREVAETQITAVRLRFCTYVRA